LLPQLAAIDSSAADSNRRQTNKPVRQRREAALNAQRAAPKGRGARRRVIRPGAHFNQ
jgi:hypothetical protein